MALQVSYVAATGDNSAQAWGCAMEQGRGIVAYFDEKANYGFIEPDDDSGDVVFSVPPGGEPLNVGDAVIYDLVPPPSVTTKGPEALRVRRVGFAAVVGA